MVERGFDQRHHARSRTNAQQIVAMTASQAKQSRMSKQGNNLNNDASTAEGSPLGVNSCQKDVQATCK